MSHAVTVSELDESAYDTWRRLVSDSEQGSAYSSPEYLEALCRAAGGRFRIVGAFRGTEIAGGVALYERQSRAGSFVAPRPLLYYNGLILRTERSKYPSQRTSATLEVVTALADYLARTAHGSILLKNHHTVSDARVFQAGGWRVYPTYTYVMPLTDTAAQWDRVDQNLRRLVTRCASQGYQLTDDDDFEGFFRLHEQTVERKQAELYLPRRAFSEYFATLRGKELCRLYQARDAAGQLAATQLVLLGPYGTSHTVSAATAPEFLTSGATAFLRWRVAESLAAAGYRYNDLTDAALNSVTRFKSQLGGNLESCLVFAGPESTQFAFARMATKFEARGRSWAKRLIGRRAATA